MGGGQYRAASEQGKSEAQFALGRIYMKGIGVPEDPAEAYVWFALAISGGHYDRFSDLSRVRDRLTPDQISQTQDRAAELFEKYRSGK